tara:strand:+ start:296 stop:553 length:258 start_codon:yes stop_codon:yes gene_type:complete
MKSYYFYSKFGYNDYIREGKIYKFSSIETFKYTIEINIDLVAISVKLNYLLRPYLKSYLENKRNIRLIDIKELLNENNNISEIYI